MSEHYLKLRRGDLEFEVRGDRDFVEAALDRWGGLVFNYPAVREPARADADPEPEMLDRSLGSPPRRIRVRRNITFKDFLKLKEPATPLDRLLTLAYFLEKYEGRPEYDLGQLDQAWHGAFPDEAFTPDIWRDGLSRGYIEEKEGRLTLSFSGEAYVQNGLADQYYRRT